MSLKPLIAPVVVEQIRASCQKSLEKSVSPGYTLSTAKNLPANLMCKKFSVDKFLKTLESDVMVSQEFVHYVRDNHNDIAEALSGRSPLIWSACILAWFAVYNITKISPPPVQDIQPNPPAKDANVESQDITTVKAQPIIDELNESKSTSCPQPIPQAVESHLQPKESEVSQSITTEMAEHEAKKRELEERIREIENEKKKIEEEQRRLEEERLREQERERERLRIIEEERLKAIEREKERAAAEEARRKEEEEKNQLKILAEAEEKEKQRQIELEDIAAKTKAYEEERKLLEKEEDASTVIQPKPAKTIAPPPPPPTAAAATTAPITKASKSDEMADTAAISLMESKLNTLTEELKKKDLLINGLMETIGQLNKSIAASAPSDAEAFKSSQQPSQVTVEQPNNEEHNNAINKLKEEAGELHKKLAASQNKIEELTTETKTLQSRYSESIKKIESDEIIIKTLQSDIEKFKNEAKAANDENNRLELENSSVNSKYNEMKAKCQELTKQVEMAQKNAHKEMQDIKNENEQFKIKINDYEAKVAELKNEIDQNKAIIEAVSPIIPQQGAIFTQEYVDREIKRRMLAFVEHRKQYERDHPTASTVTARLQQPVQHQGQQIQKPIKTVALPIARKNVNVKPSTTPAPPQKPVSSHPVVQGSTITTAATQQHTMPSTTNSASNTGAATRAPPPRVIPQSRVADKINEEIPEPMVVEKKESDVRSMENQQYQEPHEEESGVAKVRRIGGFAMPGLSSNPIFAKRMQQAAPIQKENDYSNPWASDSANKEQELEEQETEKPRLLPRSGFGMADMANNPIFLKRAQKQAITANSNPVNYDNTNNISQQQVPTSNTNTNINANANVNANRNNQNEGTFGEFEILGQHSSSSSGAVDYINYDSSNSYSNGNIDWNSYQ